MTIYRHAHEGVETWYQFPVLAAINYDTKQVMLSFTDHTTKTVYSMPCPISAFIISSADSPRNKMPDSKAKRKLCESLEKWAVLELAKLTMEESK